MSEITRISGQPSEFATEALARTTQGVPHRRPYPLLYRALITLLLLCSLAPLTPSRARADRIALLGSAQERALLAPALRLELGSQGIDLVEADSPPGTTRVARAASAQALASALDARASVWIDEAGSVAIVRVVPSSDGEPRQAPLPEVAEPERARVFAVVAASLLAELTTESLLPVTTLRVELAAPLAAPRDSMLPTVPETYVPGAMPYEGPAELPAWAGVGVRPYAMVGLALGAFLENVRQQFFGEFEVAVGLELGRFISLALSLGIGTNMDEGTSQVPVESAGFRAQFRPGVELSFNMPFNDDVDFVLGPRTLFVAGERPMGCCAPGPIPASWTWGAAFGGFIGARWDIEDTLRAALVLRVDGQGLVAQAYGAEAVTTLAFRLELH